MKWAIFSDFAKAKQIKLKSTKLQSILHDVLGTHFSEKIKNEAKDKFFLLLVDESTDIFTTKVLCILIKFVDNGAIKTYMLDLIKMSADGATGVNLFNSVKEIFNKNGLKFSKIVGFCSDNATSMMGTVKWCCSTSDKRKPTYFYIWMYLPLHSFNCQRGR